LNDLKSSHSLIGNIAGVGLHLGVDLVKDRKTKERAVDEAEIVMYKCMEKGLAFKTIEGNIVTLRPALIISKAEMDRAIDILDKAIGEVEAGRLY
jgi:4-aminobutyrate aminotransferase